MQDYIATLYIL